MTSAVSLDPKAGRWRLAALIEGFHVGLEQAGALREIYRHSRIHEETVHLDLLQTAKALRSYAGILSLLTSTAPEPQPRADC